MGWFTVLKGAYPSLQQIDKALNVAAGQSGIVRGSLIYQTTSNTFALAGSAQATDPTAYCYIALMSQLDLVAGMAGTIGQGVAGGVARVSGLAMGMPFEFESDQFISATYAVGDLLTVGAGGKLALHTTGDNCVAQVTRAVYTRYVNDAVAVTGWRTGANVAVLTARTLWIPLLVTA